MRKIIIILILFLTPSALCAQFTDGLFQYGGTVGGPLKQIIIIVRQIHDPSDVHKDIAWFDTIGRITKKAFDMEGTWVTNAVYKYTDQNACWCYQYDENGNLDSHSKKIIFDSNGREFVTFYYHKDHLTRVDSIVYDQNGNIIEKYASPYGERIPQLEVVYAYDSIGRLVKEHNLKQQTGYTITYLPNNNYNKQHFDITGNTYTEECVINKKGQLVLEKSKQLVSKYSSYDKYGNWHKRESTMCEYGSITERKIEYYKK